MFENREQAIRSFDNCESFQIQQFSFIYYILLVYSN